MLNAVHLESFWEIQKKRKKSQLLDIPSTPNFVDEPIKLKKGAWARHRPLQ